MNVRYLGPLDAVKDVKWIKDPPDLIFCSYCGLVIRKDQQPFMVDSMHERCWDEWNWER